ncbi:MAG: NosD domain-containing protein [Candidatus Odinarchaeota archaeon]
MNKGRRPVMLVALLVLVTLLGTNQATYLEPVNESSNHQYSIPTPQISDQKVSTTTTEYVESLPIYIDEDTDFGPAGYAFPGLGTSTEPYVIENYNITSSAESLISIRDTSVHFRITNCLLDGIDGSHSGIDLYNVANGQVDSNQILNCLQGMYIDLSTQNTISGNTVSNCINGGNSILRSWANHFTGNTAHDNGLSGFFLNNSTDNTLSSNIAYNNGFSGFYVTNNSFSNVISDNDVYSNTYGGVNITSTVVYNTVVVWNNFIDNNPSGASQAYDAGVSSSFKYNYWDEWTTPDSDFNGIVDSSYAVEGTAGNFDSFPRTSEARYLPHAPITITDDTHFGPSGYNFNGTGTESDPYMIERLNITDYTAPLIHIQNTVVHFRISNCLLNGIDSSNDGIRLSNVANGTIDSNIVHNCSFGIILVASSTDNTVSNNECFYNTQSGIGMYSFNNTVAGNTCFENTWAGIVLNYAEFNEITGNTCHNNNFYGIQLLFENYNNNITDNTLYGNKQHGIYVSYTGNAQNVYRGNTIYNNPYMGIYLWNSTYDDVKGNIVYDNGQDGIWLRSTNYTTVYGNSIYNNSYGIYLWDSAHGNSVAWNEFISSRAADSQAKDEGYSNVFEYNYWSEWTAPDNDFNAIVDIPYTITGGVGSSDPYPRTTTARYLPRAPIYISNNADFGPSGYNFPGYGTESHPYVIRGYNITSQTTTTLIEIWYTTVYFKIVDCLIDGTPSDSSGVYFRNVTHGVVEDNLFRNCITGITLDVESLDNAIRHNMVMNSTSYGVFVFKSNRTTVSHNTVNGSYSGIILAYSNYSVISGNSVSYGKYSGIVINYSINNTITGNSVYKNAETGIYLYHSLNTTINGNEVHENVMLGILLGELASNNSIFGNHVYKNYQTAIRLDNSWYNRLLDNNIHDNGGHAIYLTEISSHNTIKGNTVSSYNDISTSHGCCIMLHTSCNSNNITGNILYDGDSSGIRLYLSHYNIITGNQVHDQIDGIELDGSDHNTVSTNTVYDNIRGMIIFSADYNIISGNNVYNNEEDGAWIREGSDHNTVELNEFYGNGFNGLFLQDASDNIIYGNHIYDNGMAYLCAISGSTITQGNKGSGMYIDPSHRNIITNNDVHDNYVNGIYIYNSQYNNLSGNDIHDNGADGLFIENSAYTVIVGNAIVGNGHSSISPLGASSTIASKIAIGSIGHGIFLDPSSHSVIMNNYVAYNGYYGVFIGDEGTVNTTVKLNDFIGNNLGGKSQAYDIGDNNKFFNNFWDNHDNTDSELDGIADKPYAIDGTASNMDASPMANPIQPPVHYLLAPIVMEPNGGETLEGQFTVSARDVIDSVGHTVTYAVYYSADGGNTWVKLVSGLTGPNYLWDTTKISDGSTYMVMVVAICSEGLRSGDISDQVFTIDNGITTTTTTTPAETTTTGTSGTKPPATFSPGWTIAVFLISCPVLVIIRAYRRKR